MPSVSEPPRAAPAELRPLRGLALVERAGGSGLGALAVGFAAMMAAQWGADVRVPARSPAVGEGAPPRLPDGSSALQRFLARGKRPLAEGDDVPGAWLVTDDEAAVRAWPDARTVLVRAGMAGEGGAPRPQSELTVMAASGLLDIVAEADQPPLPMPGHQVAYAAGLAALAGLTAAHAQVMLTGVAEPVTVSALDVAAWLNWKNRLSAVSGNRQTGRDRKEEWITVACRDGYIAVIFRDRDIPDMARLLGLEALDTPEFIQEKSRVANLDEFHRLVAGALARRGRDEVLAQADALGLQFSAVLDPAEMFGDPQMQARRFFADEAGLTFPRLPVVWQALRADGQDRA
ncbi:hypothetical protein GCM10023144_29860 [Pigmentiphaga soli]|uniref:Uncharacterized protein n=1 Tax=Pigmentiphaga soli TaxID=1007095 RepID=A0ABP8H9J0_9BURK